MQCSNILIMNIYNVTPVALFNVLLTQVKLCTCECASLKFANFLLFKKKKKVSNINQIVEHGGVKAILKALRTHPDSELLHEFGCGALANMAAVTGISYLAHLH